MFYVYNLLLHLIYHYLLYVFCFFFLTQILIISKIYVLLGLKMNEDDICLINYIAIRTIL